MRFDHALEKRNINACYYYYYYYYYYKRGKNVTGLLVQDRWPKSISKHWLLLSIENGTRYFAGHYC